jgi:signal transduction histidine kinase
MPSDGSRDPGSSALLARLREHRTLKGAPEPELEWIVAHGRLQSFGVGEAVLPPDLRIDELLLVLSGQFAMYIDRGAGPRRTEERRAGDVTGLLPYSRLTHAPTMPRVEEPVEFLAVHRDDFPEMIRECHVITSRLVQQMIDRARRYTHHDLYEEKMLSLGRLAAGLAHELDNPASAALRSSRTLPALVEEALQAERARCEIGPSPAESAATEALLARIRAQGPAQPRSPLEHAQREDALSDWLLDHGVGPAPAEPLAETPITLETLAALQHALRPEVLEPALRCVAAACTLDQVMREIAQATGRISDLVRAVKAFTHMDEAAAPGPVDVRRGLADTLAVLESKAKAKGIRVGIEADIGLPPVVAVGAELNQVWSSLIDNALDAVPPGGRVDLTARREGDALVVRVVDDGPGVPQENRDRIFEPFFTTKPVGSGTGLGLDIARRLLSRQSGTIELFSAPGRTEFRVTLPLRVAERDDGLAAVR